MYGTNAISWTKKDIGRLEVIQNKVGRLALGCGMGTGVHAIRGDMGWSTFEERFMKGKLNFKSRMDDMEHERWVWKICIEMGYKSSWMRTVSRMANNCGLERIWDFSIVGVNQWRVTNQQGEGNRLTSRELNHL